MVSLSSSSPFVSLVAFLSWSSSLVPPKLSRIDFQNSKNICQESQSRNCGKYLGRPT